MPTTVAIAGLTGKFAQCIASSLQAYPDVFIRGYYQSPQKLPHSLLLVRNIKIIKDEIDDRVTAHACKKLNIPQKYLASKGTVAGVYILTNSLMETFWSKFFRCWDCTTRSLSFWSTGEETWDLIIYETAAAYTAAVALDKSTVGVLRFRGDCKTILKIKDYFEKVYTVPFNLVSLGSIEELHTTVLDLFRKNPSDVMSWALK
ncbi:hypothetical protein ASPNIDRAFT_127202 [Aspergillus niger ATCC 1015]|uniref:NmrA-like domain-containing protein n=1 Tax=Aspergillus niger (strain ATCC 1015 / CBS 113.46 / FGSC A1144 / LSHB Ac4 / NCTC 3858a / NRRL 328 / USDA 3528.7) TaxID=380704 RepID=G3XWW1_ASPNA|nr:hypothetical protein ASPNIDRAFT_127202 [Aspergillus niger ATCC 1015]